MNKKHGKICDRYNITKPPSSLHKVAIAFFSTPRYYRLPRHTRKQNFGNKSILSDTLFEEYFEEYIETTKVESID
jgi:hypothetical protein